MIILKDFFTIDLNAFFDLKNPMGRKLPFEFLKNVHYKQRKITHF